MMRDADRLPRGVVFPSERGALRGRGAGRAARLVEGGTGRWGGGKEFSMCVFCEFGWCARGGSGAQRGVYGYRRCSLIPGRRRRRGVGEGAKADEGVPTLLGAGSLFERGLS